MYVSLGFLCIIYICYDVKKANYKKLELLTCTKYRIFVHFLQTLIQCIWYEVSKDYLHIVSMLWWYFGIFSIDISLNAFQNSSEKLKMQRICKASEKYVSVGWSCDIFVCVPKCYTLCATQFEKNLYTSIAFLLRVCFWSMSCFWQGGTSLKVF